MTIIPKPALVTFPNGGENLYCFQTTPITWDPTTFYGNVKIDYSIPNENFREIINPNTGNSGDGENTPIEAEKYVCEMEVMNKGTVSSLTSEMNKDLRLHI